MADNPEPHDAATSPPPWWRRSRTVVFGAIVAGVTAAIAGGVVTFINSTGSALWRQVTPQPPLQVNAASDLTSFQRVSLFPPEFVLPLAVGELTAPPQDAFGYEARQEWADENDGVRANVMEVQVTVTGKADAMAVDARQC